MFPVSKQACRSRIAVSSLFSEKQRLNGTAFFHNKTAFKLNLHSPGPVQGAWLKRGKIYRRGEATERRFGIVLGKDVMVSVSGLIS